jgi:hypothetical protein
VAVSPVEVVTLREAGATSSTSGRSPRHLEAAVEGHAEDRLLARAEAFGHDVAPLRVVGQPRAREAVDLDEAAPSGTAKGRRRSARWPGP